MLIGRLMLMREGPHMVHVYILVQNLFLDGPKSKPAKSGAEAEYRSLALAAAEVLWV